MGCNMEKRIEMLQRRLNGAIESPLRGDPVVESIIDSTAAELARLLRKAQRAGRRAPTKGLTHSPFAGLSK